MRHVITRDAFPYFALYQENEPFSSKARYVNDVHLPRFAADCQTWSDHFCQSRNIYGTATRGQMHRGDSKDFSPSNANIISKKRRRKLRHGDSDLLRGKRKDPQIGQLAHASRGVFRPKIVLPAASDAATGLVFQSTFGSFLSLRLQIEIMRWPIPHWQIQVP